MALTYRVVKGSGLTNAEIDANTTEIAGKAAKNGNSAESFAANNLTVAGVATSPAQPAFLVQASTAGNTDITGDGTLATIVWDTEIFDQAGNFAGNAFTAPLTGKYRFSVAINFVGFASAHTGMFMHLVTSNRSYRDRIQPAAAGAYAGGGITLKIDTLADMDAGDTAVVRAEIYGGTRVIDVYDAAYTHFSGELVA